MMCSAGCSSRWDQFPKLCYDVLIESCKLHLIICICFALVALSLCPICYTIPICVHHSLLDFLLCWGHFPEFIAVFWQPGTQLRGQWHPEPQEYPNHWTVTYLWKSFWNPFESPQALFFIGVWIFFWWALWETLGICLLPKVSQKGNHGNHVEALWRYKWTCENDAPVYTGALSSALAGGPKRPLLCSTLRTIFSGVLLATTVCQKFSSVWAPRGSMGGSWVTLLGPSWQSFLEVYS